MNVRRLLTFITPIFLLFLGAASAHATTLFAMETPFAASVPGPSSGLLFFIAVGIIAGLLEARSRRSMREEIGH